MSLKLVQTALGEIASKDLKDMCDKSRLPQYHKTLMRNEKMEPLNRMSHYKKEYVKTQFGLRGKNSGLNPGVVYPRKEELAHLKQFEEAFYPPLKQLIDENITKKQEAQKRRLDWESTVLTNLSNLEKEKQIFFDKLNAKKAEKQQWMEKREKLVEEVREFLGYRANPNDERFKEALAQKEIEEAKARRRASRKSRNAGDIDLLVTKPEVKS